MFNPQSNNTNTVNSGTNKSYTIEESIYKFDDFYWYQHDIIEQFVRERAILNNVKLVDDITGNINATTEHKE